jgi:hypothetical protein
LVVICLSKSGAATPGIRVVFSDIGILVRD